MQIHEITLLNENALGAFGAGFAKGAGISLPDTGTVGGTVVSAYGDARQKAAAAAAKPQIEAMAKREMQGWNTAVTNLLKQRNLSDRAQLPQSDQQSLRTDLRNRVHKVFMQGRLGNEYNRDFPARVDRRSQGNAKELVNRLNAAIQSITNFKNNPAADAAQQMALWQELSQASYDAMSLAQFHPSQNTATAKTMPKIKPNPDKSFNIGDQKINPLDPVGKEITQKIQAAQAANSNQVPNIILAQDGIRIGNSLLDPRNPVDAKIIELIQSQQAAGAAV
jgi:hypothetical protein